MNGGDHAAAWSTNAMVDYVVGLLHLCYVGGVVCPSQLTCVAALVSPTLYRTRGM